MSFETSVEVKLEHPIEDGRQPRGDAEEDDDRPRNNHRGQFFPVRRLKAGSLAGSTRQLYIEIEVQVA